MSEPRGRLFRDSIVVRPDQNRACLADAVAAGKEIPADATSGRLRSLLNRNDKSSVAGHGWSTREVTMGIVWRRTLDERNQRFETMADRFGVDLDMVASAGAKAEFGEALGRCLVCERQTECESWQAMLAIRRSSIPDFCPNLPFFDRHAALHPSGPKEPRRNRVTRFLDFVDDLLTCVASSESRHRPPDSALRGIGIDPAASERRLPDYGASLPGGPN